jgi:hypothetical protein
VGMKAKIYGFSAFGGINELIGRFRKMCRHFNMRRLAKPICLKLKTYATILL